MPFTLCHPAIVLPLHRYTSQITSLPGLVIGSMAPDFVYFFSLGISGSFTHTPLGVPLYCLPAGLVVYLLFYLLLREPVLAWLPGAISSRMRGPVHWPLHNARSVATVMGSLVIGAASHITWDSFTHADTLIVNSFEIFRTLVPLGGYQIPLFKILQQLSSLVGFIVIAGFVTGWFKRTVPVRTSTRSLGIGQRLLAFTGVALAALAGGGAGLLFRHPKSVEHGLFNFVVAGMAAAGLAIMCLCLVWQVRVRRNTAHT
ncbi:MAG: DUF4184 family protein [Pseudomonadota bacterium]